MSLRISRRRFLALTGGTLAGIALSACDLSPATSTIMPGATPPPVPIISTAIPATPRTPGATATLAAAIVATPGRPATPPSLRRGTPPPLPADGPWNRDLFIASSSDAGKTFGASRRWLERAGVPCLARIAPDRLAAVFQWFPDSVRDFDRVAIRFSTDEGQTWSDPQRVEVTGLPPTYQRPYDPTIVPLPGGRLRLYFSSDVAIGIGAGFRIPATYSAVGSDALHYEFETGARFEQDAAPVDDPAVVRYGDIWHLIAPIGRQQEGAYHATSSDGLSFKSAPNLRSDGEQNWTGNLLVMDDALRFYGSSPRGVWWASSRDGNAWTPPTYIGLQGEDPAVALAKDGTLLLIYVGEPRRPSP